MIQNMLRYSGNEDSYGKLHAISVRKGYSISPENENYIRSCLRF